MADAPVLSEVEGPARTELTAEDSQRPEGVLNVTTGPIRGSRKTWAEGKGGIRVAMREIDLEPSSGEPPLRVYDTSGPYTDPAARIEARSSIFPDAGSAFSGCRDVRLKRRIGEV